MTTNRLRRLHELGQSVWLDDLSREFFAEDILSRLIKEDGVSGLTSNPAIFARAIVDTSLYDSEIAASVGTESDAKTIYERLMVADVREAADHLAGIYSETRAIDGYVSLEVSPLLANDTRATITEARRLWSLVGRPNLMIKVPGTQAGLPAVRALITEGINVNVTLLFSPRRYERVIDAYWDGLAARVASGEPIVQVASVASFFVSRIDSAVDRLLTSSAACMSSPLQGTAAVAAAARAYQIYRGSLETTRWRTLAAAGAQPQRLLWASTATKDPAYSDVKYIDSLIAPGTVSTMPLATLRAYRDHGEPRPFLRNAIQRSDATHRQLELLGIDMEAVAEELEQEGVQKFVEPFARLLERIEGVRNAQRTGTSVA